MQLLFLSKKCCLIYSVSVRVNQVAPIIYRIGHWVLKSFADLLAEPVTVILNASFRGGTDTRGVEASKLMSHSQN
jgi:Na+-transporting methylmalonyl-CoA/oxaloacetate decarboxylase beta subunit